MILVIDNYDSFTFNLVQYFQELGSEVCVRRNDSITVGEIADLRPAAVVISPGPGGPQDAGVSMEVILRLGHRIPIFGVCLGHQAIGAAFGGRVVRAERLMHGKTSRIFFDGHELFRGLQSPFEACRYHSLVVQPESVPASLEVIAATGRGEIMGICHRERPIFGVQFHPESILTRDGKPILRNFLDLAERFWRSAASMEQAESATHPQIRLSGQYQAEAHSVPQATELSNARYESKGAA
jgi:anthranilate synthase/aminodeoxychorismate synthase-like glutamine amidotransferase